MANWHIGEILIQKRLIDWEQLNEALSEQKLTRESVGEILVRKQRIPRFLLYKALAERHAMPFADLSVPALMRPRSAGCHKASLKNTASFRSKSGGERL